MNKQIIFTDHSDQMLTTYLKDIGRFKILPAPEINDLIVKAQHGDIKARDKVITSNLRFVVTIAKQFQNKNLPLMDLISEGNNGLAYAIEKFDVNVGTPFLSYAVYWIRQYIYQAVYWTSQEIRLPISQRIKITQLLKADSEFTQKYARHASSGELSEMTGIDESDINYLAQFANKLVSVDDFIGGDSENNQVCDIIPDDDKSLEDEINEDFRNQELNKILDCLSIRERDIIVMLFGIGMEPIENKQVARMYGVGTERIRQLKERALQRLRDKFGDQLRNLI